MRGRNYKYEVVWTFWNSFFGCASANETARFSRLRIAGTTPKPSPRDGGVSYMNRTTPKTLHGGPREHVSKLTATTKESGCREFQRLHAAFVAGRTVD
jgi:hypothetical protein